MRNCWEAKSCGREPGGRAVHELGVCPATTIAALNGVHGGENGGRACWGIFGTFCGGVVQDNMALKLHKCVGCEFRQEVEAEEPSHLSPFEIAAKATG